MARASRKDGVFEGKLPDGMKVFTVTGPTIKDSLGAYCTEGQQAVLNEADAKRYHKAKLIAVDLPDFDAASPTSEEAKAALAALEAGRSKLEADRKAFEADKQKHEADKPSATEEPTEKKEEAVDNAGQPGASEGGEAATAPVANRRQARA